MSRFFVRSTTGNDGNDGLTWATARATIAGAIPLMVTGDDLIVADDHVEGGSTNRVWPFPGTPALPNRLICAVAGQNPPVDQAFTASVRVTVGGSVTITGSVLVYGMKINAGTSTGASSPTLGLSQSTSIDAIQAYNDCELSIDSTGASASVVAIGSASTANAARVRMSWSNVALRMSAVGQMVSIQQEFNWRGGKYLAGAAAPSFLFRIGAQGRGAPVLIEGVDFTEIGTATDLFSGAQANGRAVLRNCLFSPSWTGQIVQGTIDPGFRASLYNCDSGPTRIRTAVAAFGGLIRSDTGVIKQGGAADGGQQYSWRIETNGNPTSGMTGLESDEEFFIIPTAGSPMTVAIDVLTDGVTLTDADVWLEVQECGAPKSTFYRTRVAPLGTPKAVAASGAIWSSSGMATLRPQRVSLTFTPQTVGVAFWKITLARPNTVMYVDPKRVV